MSTVPLTAQPDWIRWQRGSLVAAAVGGVFCVLGWLVTPEHFFRAYLVAYNFWLAIALGCLTLLMLHYLTGGAWGLLLRRVLEAAVGTLPLLLLAFLPILAGLHWIYPWAQPEMVARTPHLQHKTPYLNVPFFVLRAVIYYGIWLGLSFFLKRWSPTVPAKNALATQRNLRRLSSGGLVLYGLTVTFAAIDWGMSVEPLWYSTMYPVLYGVAQELSGLAFALLALLFLSHFPPVAGTIQPQHLRDLGNLLLTFVMLWAYLAISQFLLIWSENLPEEIPWYLRRLRGGWEWLALLLVLFQFALPFLLLLLRAVKQNGAWLATVAGLVLVMRFFDVFWWIEAAYEHEPAWYGLLDLATVAGLGGVWLWVFFYLLQRQELLPFHDPYWPEYFVEERHA